jgi:hypothetical protein
MLRRAGRRRKEGPGSAQLGKTQTPMRIAWQRLNGSCMPRTVKVIDPRRCNPCAC